MNNKKIEKILIALDYDPSSENIVQSEPSISTAINAEVVMLFVLSDQAFSPFTKTLPLSGVEAYLGVIPMQFENTERLKKWAYHLQDKIKNTLGNESIPTLIEEGDTALSILSAAKATNADLVVMGSHSRKWLDNIVLRSNVQ